MKNGHVNGFLISNKLNLLCSFFALFFSCLPVLASEFETINKAVTETRNHFEINKLKQEEAVLFEETGKLKHQLNLYFINAFEDYGKETVYKKIEYLLWIIEHADRDNQAILSHANYHLASLLAFLNSHNTAIPFAVDGLKLAKKNRQESLINLSYSLLGSIEYNRKNFLKSIDFYMKAYAVTPAKNSIFRASMYNNISLCQVGLNDLDASNHFIEKSLSILDRSTKSQEIQLFEILVRGNLGSNYFKQKKYVEAIELLQQEIDYYLDNQVNLSEAHNPLRELLQLYEITGNTTKLSEMIGVARTLEKNVTSNSKSVLYSKILYDFFLKKGELSEIKKFGEHYFVKNEFLLDSISKSVEKLNAILYENQVSSIRNRYLAKSKFLNESLKSKRKTNSLLVIVFTLLSVILVLIIIGKSKRERKNRLISLQQEQIQENRQKILENEVKLKQEKITSLAINLNLKKETERAFLQKLKEIKRKKDTDVEAVIKELQMNVSNLLQIDSKSRIQHTENDEENTRFFTKIKQKHPQISDQDLLLCSYFRLNLNSKEIAQLTNMTSGTIRVYKTKLKAKLGLNTEHNLETYLSTFDN